MRASPFRGACLWMLLVVPVAAGAASAGAPEGGRAASPPPASARAAPRAALDWTRPPRYGALADGIVVQRSPYEPMEVVLDACGSTPGAAPIATYTFTTTLPGMRPVTQAGCRLTVQGEAGDAFTAAVTVTDADGRVAVARAAVEIVDRLVVAVGDSYSSGEGNPDVRRLPGADGALLPARWEDEACHRSRFSPAALAAGKLEAADDRSTVTFLSEACTFHTTDDVLRRQLPALAARLAPPPGRAARRIDAVAVGVGGNDMDFVPALFLCVLGTLDEARFELFGTSCLGVPSIEASIRLGREELPARLDAVLGAIRSLDGHVDEATRLVVTEYPEPMRRAADEWCTVMSFGEPLAMQPAEARYISTGFGGTLNEVLLSAAARHHATFTAGAWDAAIPHGACADEPWTNSWAESVAKQGCVPCREGLPCLDALGICSSFGAVHPNEAGADALGDAIVRALAASDGEAVRDELVGAPICSAVGSACAAGPALLGGAGAAEPGTPNTVTGAADGAEAGTSVDALRVATVDGKPFAPGRRATVRVEVTASVPGTIVTLWATGRALQGGTGEPPRTLLARFTATTAGAHAFTAGYPLPEGAVHGVLVRAAAPGGAAFDEDHLVFFTEGEDPCPSTWLACGDSCTFAGEGESCAGSEPVRASGGER